MALPDTKPDPIGDGLLQDLIAVTLIVKQARESVPDDLIPVSDLLGSAADTLDGSVTFVRSLVGQTRRTAPDDLTTEPKLPSEADGPV